MFSRLLPPNCHHEYRDERKKNGWSQEELADKFGVSRQSVSKWDDAEARPVTGVLYGAIAVVLSGVHEAKSK